MSVTVRGLPSSEQPRILSALNAAVTRSGQSPNAPLPDRQVVPGLGREVIEPLFRDGFTLEEQAALRELPSGTFSGFTSRGDDAAIRSAEYMNSPAFLDALRDFVVDGTVPDAAGMRNLYQRATEEGRSAFETYNTSHLSNVFAQSGVSVDPAARDYFLAAGSRDSKFAGRPPGASPAYEDALAALQAMEASRNA